MRHKNDVRYRQVYCIQNIQKGEIGPCELITDGNNDDKENESKQMP